MLTTILLTDLVGSTRITERCGDERAADIFARIDRATRDLLCEFDGQEVDRTDGFLCLFNRPIDAVCCAVAFHHRLRELSDELGMNLQARAGIHLGEIILIRNADADVARGAKALEVEGLAKPQAARIMSLALGGQTLLTRGAFDLARRGVVGRDSLPANITWMAHGSYLMKGVEEPVEVFEVGAEGVAPLTAPPDSDKVRRSVAAGDEETLGWRPAAGLAVPQRSGWMIERKLGEGGFGEVWLARNQRTGARRVFKFCFDADRLRSLKRELTLFRLLREALGDRKDIARLYEVQLDEPPFFLESEYSEYGSLKDWAEQQGGIERVPLETRLDLLARTARAVAAAHSVGILHKDIKPTNVLIYTDEDGRVRPRLSDFGIGALTDKSQLAERNITMVGFTNVLEGQEFTTTQMYAPPEIMTGKPFTVRGDIYSLGVLLYQMVIGDLEAPLAPGWERSVHDSLLRQDIAACVEGKEEDRLSSAQELASRIESLAQRRRVARRRRAARLASVSSVALIAMLGVLAVILVRENRLKNQEIKLKNEAIEQRQIQEEVTELITEGFIGSSDPAEARSDREAGREVTIVSVLPHLAEKAEERFANRPEVMARFLRKIGLAYKNYSHYDRSLEMADRVLTVREEFYEGDHPEIAESYIDLADVLWHLRNFEDALPRYETALAMRRRLFPERSAEVAEALDRLATCQNNLDQIDAAEMNYRKALSIRQDLPPSFDEMLVAASQNNLANCLRDKGEYEDAKTLFEAALDTARHVGGPTHWRVGMTLHNLARCLDKMKEHEEADQRFREAIDVKQTALGRNHLSVAETEHSYAAFLLRLDRAEEALPHALEAFRIRQAVGSARKGIIADARNTVIAILRSLGREAEADQLAQSADSSDAEDGSGASSKGQ